MNGVLIVSAGARAERASRIDRHWRAAHRGAEKASQIDRDWRAPHRGAVRCAWHLVFRRTLREDLACGEVEPFCIAREAARHVQGKLEPRHVAQERRLLTGKHGERGDPILHAEPGPARALVRRVVQAKTELAIRLRPAKRSRHHEAVDPNGPSLRPVLRTREHLGRAHRVDHRASARSRPAEHDGIDGEQQSEESRGSPRRPPSSAPRLPQLLHTFS